jgi:stage V sporulation protein S
VRYHTLSTFFTILEAVAMDVFKVSARSRSTSVAGAIAGVVREGHPAEVQAIGAGAVNQAIKAIAIARGYLAKDGIEVVCVPTFVEVDIEGQERTAVKLTVLKPDQPLPPATPLPRMAETEEHGNGPAL